MAPYLVPVAGSNPAARRERRSKNQTKEIPMLARRFFRFAFPLLAITAGAIFLSGCHRRHCGWNASPEEKANHITKKFAKELDLTAEQ